MRGTGLYTTVSHLPRRLAMAILLLYSNYISLLFAPRCRFYPSCSRYAYEAVATHGIARGIFLATKRLLKCHPWHEGGFDKVPPARAHNGCCQNHTNESSS